MARPIKYKTDEDRFAAAQRSGDVIREIKQKNNWKFDEFSARLAEHDLIIHSSLLRSYGCGKRPLGEARLNDLVELAVSQGWAGEKCMNVWLFHNPTHRNNLKKINESLVKMKASLEMGLLISVKNLVWGGYSRAEIESLVVDSLDKLRDHFEA